MDITKNVFIVGGGPAGLSSALFLAKKNIRVCLCDKNTYPIEKVCGEGIMPTGIKYLKKIDPSDKLAQIEKKKFLGIRYLSNNLEAYGRFSESNGYGIKRQNLSKYLKELCEENPLITLYENHKFEKYEEVNEQFDISLVNKDNNEQLDINQIDYLVAADGRLSKIRNDLNLEGPPPTKKKRKGARIYVGIEPWTDLVEVYWSENIEAYVTPIGNKMVSVLFSWENNSIKANESDLLHFFPRLKQKLDTHPRIDKIIGIGNLAHVCKVAYQGKIALVGDAACFLDGITGEGISLALEGAHELAEAIENDDLEAYNKKMQSVIKKYVGFTNLVLLLSDHTILRFFVIKLLSLNSSLFSHFLEVNMGSRKLISIFK